METLQAKFAGDSLGLYNCTVKTNCDESVVPEHCWSCVPVSPPPPFAPPDFQTSGQNRITPYLVSGVCALGVAFLILTTCGILLRCRWFRRRNSATAPVSGDAVFLDEDHGPVDHPIWRIVTVGLPQSVIESITAMKYKKGDGLIEGTDCSVCLTEFADGDDLRLLPKCNHAFHITCIDTWLRSHKNCPLCRSPVVNPVSSGELGSSGSARMENPGLAENVDQEEEQNQQTERDGEFDPLPVLGGRIAEILKNNRGKRAISDLGEHHRLIRDEFQPVRRTVSLDASSSASAINNSAVVDVAKLVGVDEAASSKEEEEGLESNSISRLMMSSSIGRSLQKAPVTIKRSFSSSTKILSSFRASKNLSSSSILPL